MSVHACAGVQLYKWRPETLSQLLPFLVKTVSLPGPELTKLANLTIQAAPGICLFLPLRCWNSNHATTAGPVFKNAF